MRYVLLLCIYAGLWSSLYAQERACDCLANLNQLVAKTEENYAGYPHKITSKTNVGYQKLVISLRKKAASINQPKACYILLKEYVLFFKDKHFILNYATTTDVDNEYLPYTEATFTSYLKTKGKRAPLEGIYKNPEGTLTLGIKQTSPTLFKAIVLNAQDPALTQGKVYFTLTKTAKGYTAKLYDVFISTDTPAKLVGNLLWIWDKYRFGKVFPTTMTAAEKTEWESWRDQNNGLAVAQLSPKTAYLRVPTFLQNDDKIQQLVMANDSLLRHSENLIVDLCGNGGGNTGWVSFLPYFMTQPIEQYPSWLRVTPENVASKRNDLAYFVNNPIPEEYKKYFPDATIAAYKKAFTELPTTKETFYPIPGVTFPLETLLPSPKKIALLVDDMCGSSTEYFFFLSKQSSKTTTFGIPTFGMMDYEGMGTPTPMPDERFIITIPISASSWTRQNPIDQSGWQPDVMLSKLPQAQWVKYVQEYLEGK